MNKIRIQLQKTIIVLILLIPINAFSQNNIVSIQPEDSTLQSILTSIRDQTGYDYILNDDVISPKTRIDIIIKDVSIDKALKQIFKNLNASYKVNDKTIIITPKVTITDSRNLVISGRVVDSENKDLTLPNAHIRIKNTSRGCVTNTDGNFQFRTKPEYRDSILIVSYVGYESYEMKISKLVNKKNIIPLKLAKNEISEVVVKPPDPVEILAKVAHNFKQNYWQESINANAFYREILFQDGKAKRMSEAACEFYIKPFKHSFDVLDFNRSYYKSSSYDDLDNALFLDVCQFRQTVENHAKIIESRSSYDITNTGLDFYISGGPIMSLSYDMINTWENIFEPKKTFEKTYKSLKNFKYLKVYHSEWEGKPIYILKGINNSYYIDKETFAIIQYSIKYIPYFGTRKITQYNKRIKKYKSKKDKFSADSIKIDIKYFPWKGKWYYKSISAKQYSTYLPYKGENVKLKNTSDLMFNSTTLDSVHRFNNNECFKNCYNSSLYHYATDYKPDFWENYNVLYPTKLQKEVRKSLEEALPLSAQYASKFEYDTNLTAPIAKTIPDTLFINNDTFPDNYTWLESGNEDSIISYVRKENKYADNFFVRYAPLIRKLSNEIAEEYSVDRFIKPKEWTKQIGDYTYYYDTLRVHDEGLFRKNSAGVIDTLIDFREKLKQSRDYYIDWIGANPDNTLFCYREYPVGSANELDFHLIFMDVKTKTNIDTIRALTCKWITDSTYLNLERVESGFFNRKLYYRNLKNTQSKLLYQTSIDNAIWYRESKSKEYVFVEIGSNAGTDSVFYIKEQETEPELKLLATSPKGKSFIIDHYKGKKGFYINTNINANKWCLYNADGTNPIKENWKTIIPEDKEKEINLLGKKDSLFILSSLKGITKDILFYSEKTDTLYSEITFPDEHHTASFLKSDSLNNLLISYDTYLSPTKYYNYNLKDKSLTLLGSDTISNYDEKHYVVKIEEAISQDGETIPVVLIYNKKEKKKIGKSPLLLETYGGGNTNYNPGFRPEYLPLLNRGFIVGFALVRGSAELGTFWKDKAVNKNVAISGKDFADVAKHLIERKITSADKLFAIGTSHGGFVMSYVANNYPEFFKGIIVDVPAGDLLTQLSDSTIADNRFDYNLFGSPYILNEYETLKKTCPYQNIKKQDYPNMLYFTGWLDINANPVTAVKQVAKLRANKTDDNLLLLRVLMNSGHSAVGGKYFTKQAWMYAFMMHCLEK